MDNNELKPGTVLVGGYERNQSVIVALPGQPPGSVAVYSPQLNCVTVYCQPEMREFEPLEDDGGLFDAMEEHALYVKEQAERVIAFACAMRSGDTSVELPMGVQVFYKDMPETKQAKTRVNVEFSTPSDLP